MTKAEKTRQFIIEKTAPIFNTKGYAGTSLSDITEATGLTKGSIYGNFANKDEVALAAFDHNLQTVQGIIRNEMSQHESVKEKLLVYVNVYNDFTRHSFPVGGCPILNTAIEADDTHPVLKKKVIDAIAAWKKNMAGLVRQGIENKEFRKDVDAEQVALTIIALIEGGIMIRKITGSPVYKKSINEAIEAIVHGLA
ncbi:MAG: TetR/AcrR family transcriptional regulator [Flavipsychrobacter sp.]|nr:TetR/AcrR family transcriptional regulator [Flavipsychrobacter sp.]